MAQNDTPQDDRRMQWRVLLRQIWMQTEIYSGGSELYSAGRFCLWGVYFMLTDPVVGPNPILGYVTRGVLGGLLLLLLGVVHLAALFWLLPTTTIQTILIRKVGVGVALVLSVGTFFVSWSWAAMLPGVLMTPLAQVYLLCIYAVAVVRHPASYRTRQWFLH